MYSIFDSQARCSPFQSDLMYSRLNNRIADHYKLKKVPLAVCEIEWCNNTVTDHSPKASGAPFSISPAGFPTYEIVWTYKHPTYRIRRLMEIGPIVHGSKGYFVDYAASIETFSKYLPIAPPLKYR